MKLAGKVLTALAFESMADALALLRESGIDPDVAFDVLINSLFDGAMHKTYGGKIVDEHRSPPGVTAALAVKDLRLAPAEPATSLVHDRLGAVLAHGWTGFDCSASGLLAASNAGLKSRRSTDDHDFSFGQRTVRMRKTSSGTER